KLVTAAASLQSPYILKHTHSHTCTQHLQHTDTHMYTHVHTCTHMYTRMHTHPPTHTHTHTHTHTSQPARLTKHSTRVAPLHSHPPGGEQPSARLPKAKATPLAPLTALTTRLSVPSSPLLLC